MTRTDSQFLGYVVDQYLKVQVVTDAGSRINKVSKIKNIDSNLNFTSKSSNGGSSRKLKISGIHSSSDIFKELIKNLEYLGNGSSGSSKAIIIDQMNLDSLNKTLLLKFYHKHTDGYKRLKGNSMGNVIEEYSQILESNPGTESDRYPSYHYSCLINFIDLLSNLKSDSSQKAELANERKRISNTWFFEIPEIDSKLVKSTARNFQVNPQIVEDRLNFLRLQYTSFDLYKELKLVSQAQIMCGYSMSDYINTKAFEMFTKEMNSRYNDLLASVEVDGYNAKTNPVRPTDNNELNKTVEFLLSVITNNKGFQDGIYFKNILKCFDCWLVDPYELIIKFLTMALNPSKLFIDEENNELDINWINAIFTFAQTMIPSTLLINIPITWPSRQSKRYLSLIHNFYLMVEDFILNKLDSVFEKSVRLSDSEMSEILTLISFIDVSQGDFKFIKEKILGSLDTRVNTTTKELFSHIESANSYRDLTDYVHASIEEIDFLVYLKVQFKRLNIFGSLTLNDSIQQISQCVYEGLVNKLQNMNVKFDNSFLIDFVTVLGHFKLHPSIRKLPYDFSFDKLSKDLYQLVSTDWKNELHDKCKTAIKFDSEAGFKRLPDVGYSKSIQTIIELCESYTNVLNDFQFNDDIYDLALIYASLTSSICDNLIFYSKCMTNEVLRSIKASSKLKEYPTASMCTCLNNTLQTLEYLKDIDTSNFEQFSKALSGYNQNKKKQILNLKIVNLENVEEEGGKPPSLSIRIGGLINSETSSSYKDFNPSYDEIFKASTLRDGTITFDIKNEAGALYRSVSYHLNSKLIPKQVRLSLEPKPGSLNIEFFTDIQRNDPVYYIGSAINEVTINYEFMIKSIVLNLLEEFKDFFNKVNLDKSIKERPVRKNQQILEQEPYFEKYITSMKFDYLHRLYSNLEDEVFVQIYKKLWDFILSYATNLLLPRLSTVYNKILAKLNRSKRISMSSIFSPKLSGSKANIVSKDEIYRVYEWIDRFYQQLINTDEEYIHVFDDQEINPLYAAYDKFRGYKTILELKEEELKTTYCGYWTAYQSVVIRKIKLQSESQARGAMKYGTQKSRIKLKDQETEIKDLQAVLDRREIILRALLALYGSTRFVKSSLQRQERYLRAVSTDMDVAQLVSYL